MVKVIAPWKSTVGVFPISLHSVSLCFCSFNVAICSVSLRSVHALL